MNWYKLLSNIKNFPHNFRCGVENLITYFKIVWKDRDWDDYYIYQFLIFKIKKTSKHIREHDFHLNAKRDSEIMDTVVKLLERDRDEYYSMEFLDYHKSKFNWIDTDDCDGCKQLEIEEISNNLQEYFEKYPLVYKKAIEEINKEKERYFDVNIDDKFIAIHMGRLREEKAHYLAFELINRNIRKWWD